MDLVVSTMELEAVGLETLLARARSGSNFLSDSTVGGCSLERLSTPRYAQVRGYTSDSSDGTLHRWRLDRCFRDISCVWYIQVTCQRRWRSDPAMENTKDRCRGCGLGLGVRGKGQRTDNGRSNIRFCHVWIRLSSWAGLL
jgi:hypothetical protein